MASSSGCVGTSSSRPFDAGRQDLRKKQANKGGRGSPSNEALRHDRAPRGGEFLGDPREIAQTASKRAQSARYCPDDHMAPSLHRSRQRDLRAHPQELSMRLLAFACSIVLALCAVPAGAETVVRYGISLADIPLTTGQPDRGAGAYQFTGYTLYDPLVAWEMNVADRPGKLIPGLATEWKVDAADKKKWL